jgi:tRNA dimethylallyltransferase
MSDNERFPVVIVAGPTASGKSALALSLAEAFRGTIINADSMQVYRELWILTARPNADEVARVPHRLYGVLPASEACTAARWRDMAIAAIGEAREEGRLPIVCGGTGLYFKALMEGLSPIPDIPAEIRDPLRERFAGASAGEIRDALAAIDPKAAGRIPPTDRQRLLRALEVHQATGRSIVDWQDEPLTGPPAGMDFITIRLSPPRQAVYAACDTRFRQMIDAGALDEVRSLMELNLDADLPAMKALGVPELMRLIRGEITLEAAIAAVQQATRNYVKRQETWFSRQIIANLTIKEQYSEKLDEKIFSFICEKGLTRFR